MMFLYVTYITEFTLGGPDSRAIRTIYPSILYVVRMIEGILYLRCVNIRIYKVLRAKTVTGPILCIQTLYKAPTALFKYPVRTAL